MLKCKNFKGFLLVALLVLISFVNVSAIEEVGYSPDTQNILVQGTLPLGMFTENANVSVMLVLNDAYQSGSFTGDDLGYFDICPVDSIGNYNIKFKFYGNIENYVLVLKAGDKDVTDTVEVATVSSSSLQKVEFKVAGIDGTSSIGDDGTINGKIILSNPYGDEKNVSVIVTEYDENGRVTTASIVRDIKIAYNSGASGSEATDISYTVKSASTKTIKIYAWENIVNMVPLGTQLEISEPKYGVDNLTNEPGDLKIAFLGGSITEGSSSSNFAKTSYAALVTEYFKTKYPKRTVTSYNAGIGGTSSPLGAVRMFRDITPYEPDVVFVEYAVNDAGFSSDVSTKGMETIVRGLLRLEKRPAIIFLYSFRNPASTKIYGGTMHTEVAQYYGIGEIDFKSYVESLIGPGKTYETANDCMKDLMKDDVHPYDKGHKLYADYIAECLDSNPDLYYNKLEYKAKNFNALDTNLKFIGFDDKNVEFSDDWELVNSGYIDRAFRYPRFPDGLMRAVGEGHKITVKFEGDFFGVYCHGISNGNNMSYNVDNGAKRGTFKSFNAYDNYQTVQSSVSGLGEGPHTITITTSKPSIKTQSNTDYTIDTVEICGFFVEK